ncbi:MAG TPA: methylated-DNA--[protein]-cysteine S-methyltransferase [Candidatus Binatia bacterium]|jgi:methylated-DNA-[protein]-cysteine S-methyltransferase
MPGDPQQPARRARQAEVVRIAERVLKTPVGVLQVAASDDAILYIELPRRRGSEPRFERWLHGRLLRRGETPVLRAALAQLRQYFAGKRRRFDVPVDPAGTEFQQRVWRLVADIPYGETVSYGRLAAELGGPELARAVGAAVGANPIPIVIPCHRVIGADGSLTGYRGGLQMKIWLLRHEGALLA